MNSDRNPGASAPPEDPNALLAGTPYRYVCELGRGAMGQVFEAEHIGLRTRVVVKLLHGHLASKIDALEARRIQDRMRLEAQALARLDHPNLLKVSDFGVTAGGRAYLVSERLVGRTLRAELEERGAMPIPEAIGIARAILDALGAAHTAGLIHRDVKPDNVFLCRAGTVKVLDFGLAKVVSAGQNPSTPDALNVPTKEGTALGTPRYMAPEQTKGRIDIDHRADLYSVGAVLYLMVAGRGPFDHVRGIFEIMRAQLLEEPKPPSHHARQPIPPELDAAILTALAKRPEDRFNSAAAFARALAAVVEPPAPPAPSKGRWEATEPLETLVPRPASVAPAVPERRADPPKGQTVRGTVPLPEAPRPSGRGGTVRMPEASAARPEIVVAPARPAAERRRPGPFDGVSTRAAILVVVASTLLGLAVLAAIALRSRG